MREVQSGEGVESVVLATRDGLLVTVESKVDLQANIFAAMAATLLGTAESSFSDLEVGRPDRVIVECDRGRVVVVGAGERALLLASLRGSCELGITLLSLEKAAKRISELL